MNAVQLFEIRYIGRCKNRQDGSQTAYGWCQNAWSVAISKSALYAWFGLSEKPGESSTLYNVLSVESSVSADEIKKAYRRLAKQWHPDVCKELDARKQFDAIQNAYTILTTKREKYDAGLALQSSLPRTENASDLLNQDYGYRSPLRCGYILGEGHSKSGKFIVEKILQWTDIFDSQGRVLVSSWPMGSEKPMEQWL